MTSQSWTHDVNSSAPAELANLLSPKEGFFSSNPSFVAGELTETPLKLISVVMLELCDNKFSRWVLVEQDPAMACGQWKFPGGRIVPGEMPLQMALRSVTEELRLLEDGFPVSWSGLKYKVLSVGLEWLTEFSMAAHPLPECENLLIFSYHARMHIADFRRTELLDQKPGQGRKVKLAGMLDVQNLIGERALATASQRVWRGYWKSVAP